MFTIAVTLINLMSVASGAGPVDRVGRATDYSPDTIIVKLKEGVTTVPEDLRGDRSRDMNGLRAFSEIRPRGGPAMVRPLFRGFADNHRRAMALRAGERAVRTAMDRQLLQRMLRMPQGVATPDLSRIYRVKVNLEPGESVLDVLTAYRASPDVEWAEPDYRVQLCLAPNDPGYPQQWPLQRISAPQAWDICTDSPDAVVAVVDTGVDYTHPDLQGNMWVNEAELNGQEGVDDDGNGFVDDIHGYDFANDDAEPLDDYNHGTGVAGIIAARGNNGTDLCGVCWRATIMAVKSSDPDTLGPNSTIVEAVYYAIINGADVISCSWGMNPPSQALYDVFQYAYSQGVVAVAGAGNNGSTSVFYPAAYATVISVGASSESDGRASWSNYGDWVDIMAPGTNMLLLSYYGGTWTAQGTSASCPYVSATCALLLSLNPSLTPAEVHDLIINNGDRVMQGSCNSNSRLNVFKALSAVVSSTGTIHFDKAAYQPGNTVSVSLFDADLKSTGTCNVTFATDSNDAETLALAEDATGTGVFHGSIATKLGAAEPNDGVLEVSDSDAITMYYRDAKGLGRMYANRERLVKTKAVIDGCAPVVSNIAINAALPQPVVTFETDEPAVAALHYRPAGAQEPAAVVSERRVYAKRHTIVLQDLAARTGYEFDIEAADRVGNVAREDNSGAGYAFTTITNPGEIHVPQDVATIQAAIDRSWPGNTIWVADGTYRGAGNRDIDFGGRKITLRSENGPQNCIIDCQGSQQSPHRGFYFRHGETADSILDGFTITGGYSQGDISNGLAVRGGAILCGAASPTIRNCILRDSAAAQGGGLGTYGGGHVTLVNCVFTNNSANWGGGAYDGDATVLELIDCTFTGNNGSSYYGGLFCGYANAQAIVTRCLFRGNTATYGAGAIGVEGGSHLTATHSRFVANVAGSEHGVGGGAIMASGEVDLLDCIFSGNTGLPNGGALHFYPSQATLTNCTFAGNTATSGRAIATWDSGGKPSVIQATNCIFRDSGDEIANQGSADIRVEYSNIQGGCDGLGNIDADPLFVNTGRWANGLWVDGDYHLLSRAGYWSLASGTWITAAVTSPCIDAGDPESPVGNEPQPNGGRIDMGAYGGTAEASKSPTSDP